MQSELTKMETKTPPRFEPYVQPVNGIVQPPVMPPPGRRGRRTNVLESLKSVLKFIWKSRWSFYFRYPVDAVTLGIPDYHNLIRHPMDLSTIRRRLHNNYYWQADEALDDFELIFENCMLYNLEGTEVHRAGKELRDAFYTRLAYLDMSNESELQSQPAQRKRKADPSATSKPGGAKPETVKLRKQSPFAAEPQAELEPEPEPEPDREPEPELELEVKHEVEPEPEPEPEAYAELKAESKAELNAETEIAQNPKLELKANNFAEPKVEPQCEAKAEPKSEFEVELKFETGRKADPHVNLIDELKAEIKAEPKAETKFESKEEPKIEPKDEPEDEPKVEPKDEPEDEPKVEPRVESNVEHKDEVQAEPIKFEVCPNILYEWQSYLVERKHGEQLLRMLTKRKRRQLNWPFESCALWREYAQNPSYDHDAQEPLGWQVLRNRLAANHFDNFEEFVDTLRGMFQDALCCFPEDKLLISSVNEINALLESRLSSWQESMAEIKARVRRIVAEKMQTYNFLKENYSYDNE